MLTERKHCIWCDTPLKGRIDKKFCNDDCRGRYHNQRNSDDYHAMTAVNHVLSRNRRILASLLDPDAAAFTVHRELLLFRGFQFNYFTGAAPAPDDQVVYRCYEFSYRHLSADELELRRSGAPSTG
ncbi:DUF2116 family Zn-ribbon domain-containing protein [Flavihumibacter petaseus]|uniref:DUF2116 family Zn-ribbon domain-containing protein n=1 Tax=Flavihumibacter petaseus TaxID=549295 RepID=UPI0009082AFE|nr:DUF2116 family Zn-ribbon domain-containing protein [Flavihumibacter petaseus]